MLDGIDLQFLAETLTQLRENLGFNQSEVARQAGIDPYVLSRLENAKVARPTFEDLAPLARFYGLDLNQMGALLGVWEVEEQEAERYSPEAQRLLSELKAKLRGLKPDDEMAFIGMVRMGVQLATAWLARQQAGDQQGQPVSVEGLPSWVRLQPRRHR